jgi:hypothetical protein
MDRSECSRLSRALHLIHFTTSTSNRASLSSLFSVTQPSSSHSSRLPLPCSRLYCCLCPHKPDPLQHLMPPLKSTSGGHFTHPSKGVVPKVSPRPTREEYHGLIQVGDALLPGFFTTNVVHDESLAGLCGEAFRASPSNSELLGLCPARVAKAIYHYDTELELLRGARDILKGTISSSARKLF